MSNSNSETPGLIGSHAQYAKGAVVEAVGNLSGSEAWQQSGIEQKAAGSANMHEAAAQRDSTNAGTGGTGTMSKVEEMAGKAVGCEGMEKEGAQGQSSGQ